MLTLIGLFLNVLSVLIMLVYCRNAIDQVPHWTILFTAVSLFIYQTLDALDGKHARRTNTSSPLGELFDHGCDALSTLFVPIGLCISIGLGEWPIVMFLQFFIFVTLFYIAHWQCYVTGFIEFGKLDVTEAQSATLIIFFISTITKVEFWAYTIPVIHLPLKLIPFAIVLVVAGLNIYRFTTTILKGGAGKSGTTVANTSILFPACPMGIVLVMAVLVATRSPTRVYHLNPCLFLLSFGFVASKVMQKLVVSHMTKSEIGLFDSVLVGPGFLLANQYFNCPLSETLMLWCCCLWAFCDMLWYCWHVCLQIADHLNIYVFRVTKPLPRSTPSATSTVGANLRPRPHRQ